MEEKSRFRKALDFFVPGRSAESKAQSNFNQLFGNDASVYGYNTSSGFFESDKLREIGDGSGNSAVVACLNVLATSFSEPKLKIVKKGTDFGDKEYIKEHPLTELYTRPNPFMSANLLSHYIVLALNTIGDAFLYKNRSARGKVLELVPLMPHLIEVRGNEDKLITHYDYYVHGKGEKIQLPVDDVVHIRQGIDPNDHRRGHAPLKSVLREILGDEAAGQYAAAILHNMAVPGVVLTPRNDGYGGPTREEAESISAMYKEKFGGANRGAPMVLSGAMNVDIVSFSPDQMKLTELRRIPEERVSAVLGVPAILAGLGAGLDSATYNNTKELREFFTEQKLVPMWRTVASELTHQLLEPDFGGNAGVECEYDIMSVRALQGDIDNLYKRVNTGVNGGWITIGEARKVVGLEVDDTHDVYLRPLNMIQVDTDGQAILNEMPEANRRQSSQEQLRAADTNEVTEEKDLLTFEDYPAVNFREPKIVMDEEPRSEEKYVAEMPNGSWCVISHDTNEVIKCFDTEKEAQAYLGKKSASPSRNTSSNMWMYDTIEAAERRAKEIGCEGYHEHDLRGTTYYMPCASHEDFERAKKAYTDSYNNTTINLVKGKYDDMNFTIPSGAKKEARRGLDWVKEHGRGGTSVGRNSARYLLNNKTAGAEKVRHIAKYFPRHEVDKRAQGWRPGEKGYPSNGRIAWALWGGETGKTWSAKLVRGMNSRDGKKENLDEIYNMHEEFPFEYAKSLKKEYPEIWRRVNTDFNSFDMWTKYMNGDRSEKTLEWLNRRHQYAEKHLNDERLNGVIRAVQFGITLNIGYEAMLKILNDQKQIVKSRRQQALETAVEIADTSALNELPKEVSKAISKKVEEHNSNNPQYKTNARTLVKVFYRGVGAFSSNPNDIKQDTRTAESWGMARVNGFLYALRHGQFKRKAYDQDLLPSSHSLSSKGEEE
tara:strand:- start:1442 stop:4261 length:2820 start_codon:yes stop_codon:yes gene_type:complete